MKKILKDYTDPTPVKWIIVGDALLIIGTTITTYAIYTEHETMSMISLICTIIGKLLTNLPKDDKYVKKESTPCDCDSCDCNNT